MRRRMAGWKLSWAQELAVTLAGHCCWGVVSERRDHPDPAQRLEGREGNMANASR